MSRSVFHLRSERKNRIEPSFPGGSLLARGYREPIESNVPSASRCQLDLVFFLVAGANGNAFFAAPKE
jgi:hypothetical protein